MSIYSSFKDRVNTIEAMKYPDPNEGVIILVDNAGGDPILGIQYQCDFRSEEEIGAGNMATIFTRTADPKNFFAKEYLLQENSKGAIKGITQADLVYEDDELIAFAGTLNSYSFRRQLIEYIRENEQWMDSRLELRQKYWNMSLTNLKAEAKARGLKGYSKLKVKQLEVLLAEDDYTKSTEGKAPEEVISQPGWFRFGSLLIFEKKDGLFTEVLQKLVEAAKVGQLVVGNGGVGAFGKGFSLFDARDLSKEREAQISASNDWYRKQMEALEPVAKIVQEGPLKNSGSKAYYFLGNPTVQDGVVKYWLNGASFGFSNGRNDQPSGYYTLQELLDEKYMEDAAKRSDESFKEFLNGNYRKEKLTDSQAEAELKLLGKVWASKPMAS